MTFSQIYRRNLWQGNESTSGPGSGTAATERPKAELLALVAELGVRSVLDAACGDGFWMPDLPGYIGVDIAPEATATSRRRHPNRRYMTGDVATLRLPTCDLVITRDAMQHLSWADGTAFLSALIRTGPRWLLASHYVGGENVDIETGGAYCPDLTAYPFWLPEPDRLIPDGYFYHATDEIRDPTKFLGLWALTDADPLR